MLLRTMPRAQQPDADVAIESVDIGVVVTGPNGPEAGVWVIAETRDLPVRYIKSVVTDDRQGRFLRSRSAAGQLQRLGPRILKLVDGSAKTTSRPGTRLAIALTKARADRSGCRALLPRHLSMVLDTLTIPAADQFGGREQRISAPG